MLPYSTRQHAVDILLRHAAYSLIVQNCAYTLCILYSVTE